MFRKVFGRCQVCSSNKFTTIHSYFVFHVPNSFTKSFTTYNSYCIWKVPTLFAKQVFYCVLKYYLPSIFLCARVADSRQIQTVPYSLRFAACRDPSRWQRLFLDVLCKVLFDFSAYGSVLYHPVLLQVLLLVVPDTILWRCQTSLNEPFLHAGYFLLLGILIWRRVLHASSLHSVARI